MSIDSGHHHPDPLHGAVTQWGKAADNTGVPTAYIDFVRTGIPGRRYTIVVAGVPVHLTPTERGTGHADMARERDSWLALRRTVTTAEVAGCDTIHPLLPAEVAAATWRHEGRDITVCRPGTPPPALRRIRRQLQRRLGVLSPVGLISAISQPFAAGATAAGLVIVPFTPGVHGPHTVPVPVPADVPAITTITGEVARPLPRWVPDQLNPPPGPLQAPPAVASTVRDHAPEPDPAPPQPAPPSTAARPGGTAPSGPAPAPKSTPAPADSPSPTRSSPAPLPDPGVLLDPLLGEQPTPQPRPISSLLRGVLGQ